MNEWDWENYYEYNTPLPENSEPSLELPMFCRHEWKATYLIFSHVYDCTKCGKKKEECESGR